MTSQWSSAIITGGLGFIGSSLAHRIYESNKEIHIIDSKLEDYGSNLYNIGDIENKVHVYNVDVRNKDETDSIIKKVKPDRVFHLAAQLSRPISLDNPILDVKINCEGSINVLESTYKYAPDAQIIFTSSQAVYGIPSSLPLTEKTNINPVDIYGVNKFTVEKYCDIYNTIYELDTTILRLTNVYGPRAQLDNPNYGVINNFIKSSLLGDVLTVFKPGTMKRDFVYIDDVTNAIMSASNENKCKGETYLVGSGQSTSINKLAELIVDVSGKGTVELVEWPDSWDKIRIGDIKVNSEKLQNHTMWDPSTKLRNGLKNTIDYYKSNLTEYIG